MGGPLFMGILTLLFFIVISLSSFSFYLIIRKDYKDIDQIRKRLLYIKGFGVLALVTGVLGQLMGLFQAFGVIEQAGDISTSLLAGGLKVSLITTLYGIIIFIVSMLKWIGLDWLLSRDIE